MEIKSFKGMFLKQATPDTAEVAYNLSLRDGKISPLKNLLAININIYDLYGELFIGEPAMVIELEGLVLGLEEETFWCRDPRETFGKDTVLLTLDDTLYRISASRILNKEGPHRVGCPRPERAPDVTVGGQNLHRQSDPGDPGFFDGRYHANVYPPEARSYKYTLVNSCGEEGVASDPSLPLAFNEHESAEVKVSLPDAAYAARIYRTVQTTNDKGVSVSVWLFVDELLPGETIYIDKKSAYELGEIYPYKDMGSLPDTVEGVTLIGNEQCIVWSGHFLWYTAVRQPGLIVKVSELSFPEPILFAHEFHGKLSSPGTLFAPKETFEYEAVIVTTTTAYHLKKNGERPTEVPLRFPPVSSFGFADMNGMLVYASSRGLIAVPQGANEAAALTDLFIDERDWSWFNPASVRLISFEDNLYGMTDHLIEGRVMFKIDLGLSGTLEDNQTKVNFCYLNIPATNAYKRREGLYLTVGRSVYLYGASSDVLPFKWRGNVIHAPAPLSLSTVKIWSDLPDRDKTREELKTEANILDEHGITLSPNRYFVNYKMGSYLIVRVIIDGVVFYSRWVSHRGSIRLPRRVADNWQFEIEGNVDVLKLEVT